MVVVEVAEVEKSQLETPNNRKVVHGELTMADVDLLVLVHPGLAANQP